MFACGGVWGGVGVCVCVCKIVETLGKLERIRRMMTYCIENAWASGI